MLRSRKNSGECMTRLTEKSVVEAIREDYSSVPDHDEILNALTEIETENGNSRNGHKNGNHVHLKKSDDVSSSWAWKLWIFLCIIAFVLIFSDFVFHINLPVIFSLYFPSFSSTFSQEPIPDTKIQERWLWPRRTPYSSIITESNLYLSDPDHPKDTIPALSEWEPYDINDPAAPPPLRIGWVIRSYSGYRNVTIILDESEDDKMYASMLPSFGRVVFDPLPPFFDQWKPSNMGLNYDRGNYAYWHSDSYSDAEFICTLDPDMAFITKGALLNMFDWDEKNRVYKPYIICTQGPGWFAQSHEYWDLTGMAGAIDCMNQLPLCLHRNIFADVRGELNEKIHKLHPTLHEQHHTNPYDTRPRMIFNTTLTAFDVTFSQLVADRREPPPFCSFCFFASYIISHEKERHRYIIHITSEHIYNAQLTAAILPPIIQNVSICPAVRSQVHLGHAGPFEKGSLEYFLFAEDAITEGLCRAAPYNDSRNPTTSDCLTGLCQKKGFQFPAEVIAASATTLPSDNSTSIKVLLDERMLAQKGLLTFEDKPMFLWNEQKEFCKRGMFRYMHQLARWVQKYDHAKKQRDRICWASEVRQ